MLPEKHLPPRLITGLSCQSPDSECGSASQFSPWAQPVPMFLTSFPSFSTLLDQNQKLGPGKNFFLSILLCWVRG